MGSNKLKLNKKLIFQICLIFLGIIIIFFTYFYKGNEEKIAKTLPEAKKNTLSQDENKKPEKNSEATVSDRTRLVELVGDKEKGKLTTLKKNFGFIERKSGVEIFFHFSNVVNEDLKELQRGQFVEYIVAAGKKGDEAREISLIREFSEDERFIENAPASNPRNSLNKSPKFTRPKKTVWEPSPFSQHDWHHGPEKR